MANIIPVPQAQVPQVPQTNGPTYGLANSIDALFDSYQRSRVQNALLPGQVQSQDLANQGAQNQIDAGNVQTLVNNNGVSNPQLLQAFGQLGQPQSYGAPAPAQQGNPGSLYGTPTQAPVQTSQPQNGGPASFQGQASPQQGQMPPMPPQPKAGDPLGTAKYMLALHHNSMILGGQNAMAGIADVQAKTSLANAQAAKEQGITNNLNQFGGQGGAGQPTGVPGQRQFISPQGVPMNAQVNPTSGAIEASQAPGTNPGPAEVTAANGLLQAKTLSDQLFGEYQKLAAKGEVGKVIGTWDKTKAQFTGGSSNPDVLAFQNAAEGLIGNLKGGAGEPSRVPQNIINRLDNLFANVDTDPKAATKTKQLLDTAIDNSLTIHTASYPQEANRIGRIQSALNANSATVSIKMPDGKVWAVPAKQAQAAIARGGVKQ